MLQTRKKETQLASEGFSLTLRNQLTNLAEMSGTAVILAQEGAPAGEFTAFDNSLCRLLQSKSQTAAFCAKDCAGVVAADNVPRRCHAGLYVIAAPVPQMEKRIVIGGRAFLKRSDYQALTERFRDGDLQGEFPKDAFANIIWSSPQALTTLGQKLQQWIGAIPPAGEIERELGVTENHLVEVAREDTPNDDSEAVQTDRFAIDHSNDNQLEVADVTSASVKFGKQSPVKPALNIMEAAAAATLSLATEHNLKDVAFLWSDESGFSLVYGIGLWSLEPFDLVCDPNDLYLLRAAESKGSMRLRAVNGRWDFIAGFGKQNTANQEAEIFPLLVNGKLKAAFLLTRAGLTNDVRRSVAEFGSKLSWIADIDVLPQSDSVKEPPADYIAKFANFISRADAKDPYSPLLQHLARLTGVKRASLMVYQEDSRELALKAGVGLGIPLQPELHVGLDDGLAGRVLQSGKPLLTRDLEAEGITPSATERAYRSKSFLCYPLLNGERRCGVLNLTDKSGDGILEDKTLDMLDALAPQVRLALERALWQEQAMRFQQMSITDPLTGLYNRRYLMARLAEESSRALRHQSPYCFIMLDLDDFKHYNDQNGHQAGDEALAVLSQCLRGTLRAVDVAARYGGEEFSILLPQTTLPEARIIGERIRQRIAMTKFPFGNKQPQGAVTVSIGIAAFGMRRVTPEDIIKAADEALYQAKAAGKNNVQVAANER